MNKFNLTVSKCCKAEVEYYTGVRYYTVCKKCGSRCDTKTITLTPDSEIAEKFNEAINELHKSNIGDIFETILKRIAEQLNIPLDK